jgi:hypothetical protein
VRLTEEQRTAASVKLLENIKRELPRLKGILNTLEESQETYKGLVYRFYHQNLKVFWLQDVTTRLVEELVALKPIEGLPLSTRFLHIYADGTGREFDPKTTNANWDEETRPIVEAFFHTKYFLQIACEYGEKLITSPSLLPSPWAALLSLYNIR